VALRVAVALRARGATRAVDIQHRPAPAARALRLGQDAVRRRFEEMISRLDDPDDPDHLPE